MDFVVVNSLYENQIKTIYQKYKSLQYFFYTDDIEIIIKINDYLIYIPSSYWIKIIFKK